MMYRRFMFLMACATIALSTQAYAATYVVDTAHTRIGFGAKHMIISTVQGEFKKFSGTFEMDDKGALTKIKAKVDVASVSTREPKRDKHLRGPDFFDAQMFPTITFVSKKVTHVGNKYTVVGEITIKADTKPITLTGELLGKIVDPWGNQRVGFRAEGKLNRKDFGVNFHKLLDTGGLVVSDMVTIILDVEGVKKK